MPNGRDPSQGLGQPVLRGWLAEIVDRTDVERIGRVCRVPRDEHHGGSGAEAFEQPRQFNAVHAGHLCLDEGDVDVHVVEHPQGAGGSGRGTDSRH